jgi:7-carboxy-7-deazaguanine synthase
MQEDLSELLVLLEDYIVTIETNGSLDLKKVKLVSPKHYYVMDMKVPSSGCSDRMVFSNFDELKEQDEIKLVIGDRNDYEWSKDVISRFYKRGVITFSPVYGKIDYSEVVSWILEDRLDVRFQVQLHKIIWGPYKTGV